jgi:hypothetical protein
MFEKRRQQVNKYQLDGLIKKLVFSGIVGMGENKVM